MSNKGKFYMTTAIAYTSGKPHIGNTYEIVLADAIARYKKAEGYDVYFQTGTDEHGQKIQEKAEAAALEAERVKGLERQVALYGLEKQFARLGYSPDDAQKAAAYQYDGDTDSLFKLQEGIQRAREAELRKSIEADIYKNIPDPKQGTGAQDDDLFLKGFNSVKSPYSR